MLRRLTLRDFVIVDHLEVDFQAGFSVLTGETGAGKSILIDALQLVLGGRGDAIVVREGSSRTEISAEFDLPGSLTDWLTEAGFEVGDGLLLRRTIDAQGKSRAWVNGSSATVTQLREVADHLVDIHGQHAWQSLTRASAVRGLLDTFAGVDAGRVAQAWSQWKAAEEALTQAREQQAQLDSERERLIWQISELEKLAPQDHEWDEIDAEHHKLSHAQSLIDAAQWAWHNLSRAEPSAEELTAAVIDRLHEVAEFDGDIRSVIDVLQSAHAQLQDAGRTLSSYLGHTEVDPERLKVLDERMSAWLGLARRYKRQPQELPALWAQWRDELQALNAASDLQALEQDLSHALSLFKSEAQRLSGIREKAAPRLSLAVTQAMQQLGMAGGKFVVELAVLDAPQSWGMESVEFLVAGHEGSTPRPLGKVASGGELSRIALAISVTTASIPAEDASAASHRSCLSTLIFDEVDSGVGGAVADTVGRLMKQLGRRSQVLAVTHLPQVAACADQHFVVSKKLIDGQTRSSVQMVQGEGRVTEIARMLGGLQQSSASLAHAQEMLQLATAKVPGLTPEPKSPRGVRS